MDDRLRRAIYFTDNEIELLRRLVHSEQLNLNDLGKWAKIVNPMITEKLPLINQLAEKLGEPDYTKEIYRCPT